MTMSSKTSSDEKINNDSLKWPALTLALSAILSIAFLLHHPTIQAQKPKQQIAEVMQESMLNNMVHGSLIAIVLLILAAYFSYSLTRGYNKLSIVCAQLSFFIGSLCLVGAALINGFIYPDFVSSFAHTQTNELKHLMQFKALLWSSNQVLANVGVMAQSLAITLWAVNLFSYKSETNHQGNKTLTLVIVLYGVGIGLYGLVSISTGYLSLDLTGMTQIALLQSLWHLMISYYMFKK